MHSAAPESCCCRNLYCTVCWRTKRRRVLAYRGSWKRLRLLTLMLIMVFGCMYLHMSSSSVKVSMFAALNLLADHEIDVRDGTRLIYMADSTSWFNARDAMQLMKDSKCPSENCRFTSNRRALPLADSVVFRSRFDEQLANSYERPAKQSWIFLSHEAAIRERVALSAAGKRFNYTVTYLRESTIYLPYWTYVANATYNLSVNANPEVVSRRVTYDATKKRGKVAWIVSNCHDVQNNRFEYAEQLGKHIQVDVFGDCGKPCAQLPKSLGDRQDCYDYVAQNYKFYLAFENANCIEYISEKLLNAYNMGVLPVVMGAPRGDYARLAPPHSFVHVEDFADVLQLAQYLMLLDANASLYSAYFKWRQFGFVAEPRYIGPHYWCQVCVLVNQQNNGTRISNSLNNKMELANWWTTQRCLRKGRRWTDATPDDFA